MEPELSSQRERDSDSDPLLDFSKIQDISPAVRARLGSEHACYFMRPSVTLCLIECAGCSESINSCQSLIALDKHWHLFCFICRKCNKLLTSEYMNR